MGYNREEDSRQKVFSRRAVFLGAAQLGAFGILASRLYYLQVLEADQYTLLADENRINYRLLPPLRGNIVDRFGQVVASNRENLQVMVVPEESPNLKETLSRVSEIVPLPDSQVLKVTNRAKRQRSFVPITVMENITWQQFSQINVHSPQLPGVVPQMGATRQYHYGPDLAHVIGYVATANENEAYGEPLLLMPGFHIGKSGVEKALDLDLRGQAGSLKVEVNAGGRVIRQLDMSPATPGAETVLTVDLEIQRFAMERLKGESAATVLMDVMTGEVLALASAPGFDPNEFVGGIRQNLWQTLIKDQYKPLMNKAIRGQYPPGSTFKMIVALAALEHGVIKPRETVRCYGRYRFGGHNFHCWKRGGHGRMNMRNGIKQSCDVYFYEVARRLGIDRIAEMAEKLGLGQTLGFEITGAKPGVVPSTGWKRAHLSEPWYPGENLVAGIGQGYVLTTPLQLAVMAARIANGGLAVEPRIVRAAGDRLLVPPSPPRVDINPSHLALIRDAMDGVVNEPGGTARRSQIDVEGLKMAGKTGTSQVRRITAAERARGVRKNHQLPWHQRDHALFVAFAPVDEPRYAISVIVEHGGGGSRAAAPIAKDIMQMVLERDPLAQTPYGPAEETKAAGADAPAPGKTAKGDKS